ncbi:MAG: hypothetical protein ACI9B7_000045 [Oleispira sp.]|jgi:hypothetical protein
MESLRVNERLGLVVTYLHNQWPRLIRYTENGAKASANLYSLVETAKANNVEPSVYLKEIFTRLPRQPPALKILRHYCLGMLRRLLFNTHVKLEKYLKLNYN